MSGPQKNRRSKTPATSKSSTGAGAASTKSTTPGKQNQYTSKGTGQKNNDVPKTPKVGSKVNEVVPKTPSSRKHKLMSSSSPPLPPLVRIKFSNFKSFRRLFKSYRRHIARLDDHERENDISNDLPSRDISNDLPRKQYKSLKLFSLTLKTTD